MAEQPRAIVDAVQITGTPGFTDAEVSDRLELDAGNRFDVRRWIEDRHRLEEFYLDRGYHRVRIVPTRREDADRTHVSLTYDIERGPQTVIETIGDPLRTKCSTRCTRPGAACRLPTLSERSSNGSRARASRDVAITVRPWISISRLRRPTSPGSPSTSPVERKPSS